MRGLAGARAPNAEGAGPRRALITGGAGFVGRHLSRLLLAEGWDVVVIDDRSTSPADLPPVPGVQAFVGRAEDLGLWRTWFVDGGLDTVFHLASPASPPRYQARPLATLSSSAEGTAAALELCRATGAHFLLASTSEVYGDPDVHPQVEGYRGNVSCTGPRSMYDEAKRFAEARTMAYAAEGVRAQIARIFNTYGPGMALDDGRMLPEFVGAACAGRPIPVFGSGQQTRSLCYVQDLVSGLYALSQMDGPCLPVNLGNPEEIKVEDLAVRVSLATAEVLGREDFVPIEYRPLPADDPRRRQPDISLAREFLGWSPSTSLETGLRAMIVDVAQRLGHPVVTP